MLINTYIGPYLVIPATLQEVVQATTVCSASCSTPKILANAKFCANCGASLTVHQTTKTVRKSFSIFDLSDTWVDLMFSPDHQNHPDGDIWLPNHSGFGVYLTVNDAPISLDSLERNVILAKTQTYYESFVSSLRNTHSVEARWDFGIVVC